MHCLHEILIARSLFLLSGKKQVLDLYKTAWQWIFHPIYIYQMKTRTSGSSCCRALCRMRGDNKKALVIGKKKGGEGITIVSHPVINENFCAWLSSLIEWQKNLSHTYTLETKFIALLKIVGCNFLLRVAPVLRAMNSSTVHFTQRQMYPTNKRVDADMLVCFRWFRKYLQTTQKFYS